MKTVVAYFIAIFLKIAFWFRYRVTVKGLDKLNPANLNKKGGILFLPNHTCMFVDPALITLAVWPKFPIRPMIVEYQFYAPIVNTVMRFLNALPVPNFNVGTNSLKRKRSEKVIQTVIDHLHIGQNFLIYPSGTTKSSDYETIGGASAVHRILSDCPDANVVLVRVKGLWGSSFSRALTGQLPPLFPTIWQGVKQVLKSLIFFIPKRHITIEFEPAPLDFPFGGTRLEINRYLEVWLNKPDGLTKQEGKLPGDSLIQVSYSCWRKEIPAINLKNKSQDEKIQLDAIDPTIKDQVISKIAELAQFDATAIKSSMSLAIDLGMDSIDIAELGSFLQDHFNLANVPYVELSTIGRVMAIAAKQLTFKEEVVEEEEINLVKWQENKAARREVTVAEGRTLVEVFLNNCQLQGKNIACADQRSGILTYHQLKVRALLLAGYIRLLPGHYIGILLPASCGAELLVMAIQLAGKVPLMVNWTVGTRHLESVKKLSNVQHILTSWAFLDKLENANLDVIEEELIMLEDIRPALNLRAKLKAFWLSKKSTSSLIKKLKLKQDENSEAVLLFTSGSESMPKGVPLSHKNILSNQRAVLQGVKVFNDDILLGMLPPFHSFGFTVTGLLCLVAGVKTVYSPDPTNGKQLAAVIKRYGVTIMGGTPTFIKSMMKVAKIDQLTTTRFCFTGAEKAQPDLFQLMRQFGKQEDFLIEGYGITECAPVLTFNHTGENQKGVGRAAPGVDLLIVHPDTLMPVPLNTQGLILARGPNIFAGYLNPGLSSPFVEVEGKMWYRTGDLGFLDEQKRLTISGRLKRFIKIGAEMISLAAIEEALTQQGEQQNWPLPVEGIALAICAKEVPQEKTKIFAFTAFSLSLEEANKALKTAGFSNLIRLTDVIPLATIPVMGSGKTNYRLLESEYLPQKSMPIQEQKS